MMSRSYCKCPDMYLVVLASWRRTIEQLVDSVVDGGGKYSGELCKLVCSCQLMAVVVTQWQWEMQHEMWKLLCISLSMAVSKIEHSGNGKFNTNCGSVLCKVLYLCV